MAFLLLHIIYQVTINSLLAGDNIEPNFNCSTWEKSVRQLGLESVRGADAGNGIRVFMPDIGMFVAGLVTWLLCLGLEEKPQVKDKSQQHDVECESDSQVSSSSLYRQTSAPGVSGFTGEPHTPNTHTHPYTLPS
uniref:Piezo TM1-24 domain-containing protein n=1 Tax=Hucho hucho TaxID=62062 RepID=A0A4W5QE64_9TELE